MLDFFFYYYYFLTTTIQGDETFAKVDAGLVSCWHFKVIKKRFCWDSNCLTSCTSRWGPCCGHVALGRVCELLIWLHLVGPSDAGHVIKTRDAFASRRNLAAEGRSPLLPLESIYGLRLRLTRSFFRSRWVLVSQRNSHAPFFPPKSCVSVCVRSLVCTGDK